MKEVPVGTLTGSKVRTAVKVGPDPPCETAVADELMATGVTVPAAVSETTTPPDAGDATGVVDTDAPGAAGAPGFKVETPPATGEAISVAVADRTATDSERAGSGNSLGDGDEDNSCSVACELAPAGDTAIGCELVGAADAVATLPEGRLPGVTTPESNGVRGGMTTIGAGGTTAIC